MAVDTPASSSNRPYCPPSNVITVLQRLRSRNPPERVDRDYLVAAGIPESTAYRTSFALEFLGLVDDEAPTVALRSIATSTDEEYQVILGNLLREAYRDVFDLYDPAQDTQDRIAQAFKRYTPASQRDRMLLFFLSMCREASIAVVDPPRQRASGAAANSKGATAGKAARPGARPPQRSGELSAPARKEPAREGMGGIPPALEMLVRSLPPEGQPLSAERRQQWVAMAEATLKFVYPEADAASPVDNDDQGEG